MPQTDPAVCIPEFPKSEMPDLSRGQLNAFEAFRNKFNEAAAQALDPGNVDAKVLLAVLFKNLAYDNSRLQSSTQPPDRGKSGPRNIMAKKFEDGAELNRAFYYNYQPPGATPPPDQEQYAHAVFIAQCPDPEVPDLPERILIALHLFRMRFNIAAAEVERTLAPGTLIAILWMYLARCNEGLAKVDAARLQAAEMLRRDAELNRAFYYDYHAST